jgi:deoxycytidylate deaminase
MNQRLFSRCIEVSRALKPVKATGRAFHTTFAVKKGKIVCIGWNDYNKMHRSHKFGVYSSHKDLPSGYKASLHSEVACIIRLGEENLSDFDIVNVRIDNNNFVAQSKPCPNCQRVLYDLSPKSIHYSIGELKFEKLS